MVQRNRTPELVPFTNKPLRLKAYATGETKEVGIFKQTQLNFGVHGRYVVNVPQGKLVKAWCGTIPVLLGEGAHVIHHPNFRLDDNHLVNYNNEYIQHGNHHILRIPRGKIAKIWIGTRPYILESRTEPYVFNTPLFKLEPKVSRVDNQRQTMNFEDASERIIEHGTIKRLLPRTGEVAVTYKNGNLDIISPTNEAIVIDSATHVVDGFLQTNLQTMVFPSDRAKELREKEKVENPDEINYEIFRTSDNLPIGVKLLVVFAVNKPVLALQQIKRNDIMMHIENLVVTDMGRAILSVSSADFQKSNQTTAKDIKSNNNQVESTNLPSAPPFYAHLQDDIKDQLRRDLEAYGIELIRLNIETPKILDKKIADKMSEYSLINAEARSRVSTLDQESQIAKQQAEQKAEQSRIAQLADNNNLLSKAEIELKAAEARAQAKVLEAEAEKTVKNLKTEAIMNELEQLGKMYHQYPELLQLEIIRQQATALHGVQRMIITPELAQINSSPYFSLPGMLPSQSVFALPNKGPGKDEKKVSVDNENDNDNKNVVKFGSNNK